VTSNVLMSLMFSKEMHFQVSPIAFRLDGRITTNWAVNN